MTVLLDANFPPLIDGFPLLPHLSHDDGRKLDLAFYYGDSSGDYAPGVTRSPIGYWAFEAPEREEVQPCAGRNDIVTLRWNMSWLESTQPPFRVDRRRTQEAVLWLATEGKKHGVSKILLEPHLKATSAQDQEIVRPRLSGGSA